MISINFFGTHDFAAGILQALIDSGLFEIKTVFTAPDRPVGRHQEITESPVKILAKKNNLKIVQPETLKNFDFTPYDAELNIVCQYGFLIPKNILDGTRNGSINVHTSLLPKYRGASPIQTALMNGDTETGVTIMFMDEMMDHGPILAQETVEVAPTDTYTDLTVKLLKKAKFLLVDTAQKWVLGPKMTPQPQDETKVTKCRLIGRNDGKIDFMTQTASQIYNLYCAFTPWPGVWTEVNGKRLKLLKIDRTDKKIAPGKILAENERIFFGCNDGAIEAIELQLEGKKPMTAKIFLNGYRAMIC